MDRRSPLVLVVAALALLLSGCSDDDPQTLDSGGDFTVRGALGELPSSADGDGALIMVGDLDRATEVGDLDRPDDPTSEDAFSWVSAVSGSGSIEEPSRVFVPLPDSLGSTGASPTDMDAVAGWSVLDVQTFVAQATPPDSLMVVSGDLGAGALADLPEVEDGIVTDVEGEDHAIDMDAGALSRLGVPTRMAEDDGRIAVSPTTSLVRDWLDDEESFAEANGDYADLADALDAEDAYSAVLTEAGGIDPAGLLGEPVSPDQVEERLQTAQEALPDEAFGAVAIGWADDDGEPLVVTAYHFGSEDAAESSADQVRELYESGISVQSQTPFSEYFDVQDVSADGEVVVVTSHVPDETAVGTAFQMLQSRDLIFTSR